MFLYISCLTVFMINKRWFLDKAPFWLRNTIKNNTVYSTYKPLDIF